MFVCPFPTDPKFWKTCCCCGFFYFYIQFCIFKQNCSNNFFPKCIITVPKGNCVGTESLCAYLHVSTRLLYVTYLDTENYMIHIAFLQHPDLKKKKKDRPTSPTLPISGQKGKQTFIFLGLIMLRAEHIEFHSKYWTMHL